MTHQYAKAWAGQFFAPADVRAWLGAGFRGHELAIVVDLREAGVVPEMMTIVIRGDTMLDSIRTRGYSARDIVDTLRTAGKLERPA